MSRCRLERAWIVRSVDGDLEPSEALRLAHHLASCTVCRIELARESRLAGLLEGEGDALSVDESFFLRVMDSLPDLPSKPAVPVARNARWRQGLRLAIFAVLAILAAGIAARALPSLQLDVAAPALPRFAPDDTGGWISLIGSAVQWIRMTAQSISWAGSPEGPVAWTIGALSLSAVIAAAAALLALSGVLARAARAGWRAS